jgi:hypothetical protein
MKIKFIIHWFHTPHDIYGNSYTYVVITDTRTGRKISSSDVPESNARLVAFYLNGQAHVHNYYWVESLVTKKQLKWWNPTYVSSDAETLAKAFMKEVRRRKAKPDGENL